MILQKLLHWLLLIIFIQSFTYGIETNPHISLTQEEKDWIVEHPQILLGTVKSYPPIIINNGDTLIGIAVDFVNLIKQRSGINFQLVFDESYKITEEKAEKRKIDGLFPTIENRKIGVDNSVSSDKVFSTDIFLYINPISNLKVDKIEDLFGKKVGYLNFVQHLKDYLLQYSEIKPIAMDSEEELLHELLIGNIDAIIGHSNISHVAISKSIQIKIAQVLKDENRNIVFSIRNDYPELISIINKTIATITETEQSAIMSKWLIKNESVNQKNNLVLTQIEKKWLQEHRELTFGIDNTYPPLNYVDEKGNLTGLNVDYIDHLAEKLGIKINYQGSIWSIAIKKALDHDVDGIVNATETEERKKYLNFSKNYALYPNGIVTRESAKSIESMDHISNKIICVKSNTTHLEIISKTTNAKVAIIETLEEGLEKVIKGEAFGVYDNITVLGYLISKYNFVNLKINMIHRDENMYGASLGLRNEDAILVNLFNKAIDNLSQEEKSIIQSKWITQLQETSRAEKHFDWEVFLKIGLPILLVLVLFYIIVLIHNSRLRHVVAEKTKDLVSSKEQFRALFDHAADAIFVHDIDGKILLVNKQACSSLGYSNSELVGKNVAELGEHFTEIKQQMNFDNLESGNPLTIESFHYHKDGSQFPVELRIGLISYLDQASFLSLARDITTRKNSEEKLRKSEQYLKLFFNNTFQLTGVLTPDGTVLMANEIVSQMSGKDMNDIIGCKIWNLPFFQYSHELQTSIKDIVEEVVRSKERIEFETQHMDKDKNIRDVDFSITPIMDSNGQVIYLVPEGIDITDRKKAEQKQKDLENQLAQTQKMEAIGTLAGGIAHDFNNILTAILGYGELVLTKLDPNSNIYEMQSEIVRAGSRAADLAKQILLFSRQGEHTAQPIEPHLIVKEALKLLRSSIPTTIEIKSSIPDDCGYILADSTQVHQIIMNLCTNAYHAMKNEGGILSVVMKNVTIYDKNITFTSLRLDPGEYIQLEVSDTGHGIKPENLSKIFEPYFTTKAKGEGTGLGLSVVHGIIKNFGGTIKIYSEVGIGTRINIYFPKIVSEAGSQSTEHKISLPGGNEKILIIDDEKSILDMMELSLQTLGYEITTKNSSREAYEIFKKDVDYFDLIISDMTMPHMTGLELTNKIFKLKPKMPIIICTGFSELITKEKAIALGIKGFINKPILRANMAVLVRKILDSDK